MDIKGLARYISACKKGGFMSEFKLLLQSLRNDLDGGQSAGFVETAIQGVRFFWSDFAAKRAPMLYEAGIIIIGQGHKIVHIDNRSCQYDSEHYLVVGMPSPVECETHASFETPLLGIFIDIDLTILNTLVANIGQHESINRFSEHELHHGIKPVSLNSDMKEVSLRLLKAMRSPMDAEALGSGIVHEIFYRALLGEHGSALYALTQHHSNYARIARALNHVHAHYMNTISVDELAGHVHMSTSAFYRTFKEITGESPLQYIKKTRLNKAKALLTNDGIRANAAASQVGYESPSQFSREFKRYFGVAPTEAAN